MKVGGRERQTAGGDERSGWWVVRGREESSRRYKSDVDVGVRVDSGIDVPQCSVGRGRCSLAASECRERGIQTNEGLRGKRQGGDGKKAGGNSGEIERGRGVERARGQEGKRGSNSKLTMTNGTKEEHNSGSQLPGSRRAEPSRTKVAI